MGNMQGRAGQSGSGRFGRTRIVLLWAGETVLQCWQEFLICRIFEAIQQIVAYDILEVHRVKLMEVEEIGCRLRALSF